MFSIRVKHTIRFLEAMIDLLLGDAHMSLEGDLSRSEQDLKAIPGATTQATDCLKPSVIFPRSGFDFVIVPLEPATREVLVRRVLPQIGIHRRVLHVHIEKGGQLQLMAYDNFHPDCVAVGPQVPEAFLRILVDRRILYSYEAITQV